MNNKLLSLFLLLLISLFSINAVASDWFYIGLFGDSQVFFVDAASVKPIKDSQAEAWVRIDLIKPKWNGLFKESAKKYLDKVYFDCAGERTATVNRVIYGTSGASLDNQSWQANYIPAPPNSISSLIVKKVCEKAYTKNQLVDPIPENALTQTSWKVVNNDDKSTIYIGTSNYSWGTDVLDGVIFFLVRTDNKTQSFIGNDPLTSNITQWAGRCDSRKMFITQDIYYGINSQAIARTEFELKDNSVITPPVNSIGDAYLKTACNDLPKAKGQKQSPSSELDKNKFNYGSGTAWQVSENKLVTAYHVVDHAQQMFLYMPNGEYKEAKLIASDPQNDLAIVQVTKGDLTTKPLAISTKQSPLGTRVAVIGYPLSDLLGRNTQATTGEISKLSGMQDDLRFYQISAAVQSGNSGGPVLNKESEVVGVVISKTNQLPSEVIQNVNFAIKSAYISPLLESAKVNLTKSNKKTTNMEDAIKDVKDSIYLIYTVIPSETKH